MIKVRDVVKWFGPTLAVDGVSFDVEKGEVLGFLGPNGAGKSTTMRIITGFLPLSSGKVEVGGHDIEEDTIAAKSLIGYLPENAPAYPEMSVSSFLHFVAEIRGLCGAEKSKAVDRVVDTCSLQSVRYQTVETLSKGYRHRACFAQSIIHDPPILVMDEPTDGLDPNQKHEVRELITRMSAEKAIIVSTHILEEVEAICTRVVIIDRGKVVAEGTPDELKTRSDLAGAVTVRVLGQNAADVTALLGELPAVARADCLEEAAPCVVVRAFQKGASAAGASLAGLVGGKLSEKGWRFDELHTEEGRLEEVFRSITIGDAAQEASK